MSNVETAGYRVLFRKRVEWCLNSPTIIWRLCVWMLFNVEEQKLNSVNINREGKTSGVLEQLLYYIATEIRRYECTAHFFKYLERGHRLTSIIRTHIRKSGTKWDLKKGGYTFQ